MISHIKGIIEEKFNNSITVDAGGIGYEIVVSALDFDNLNLNDHIKIYT